MKFFTSRFLAIAAAVSQALAEVQLTNSAYAVTENQPFTITWSGAEGAVTLTLKDGSSTDLKTVSAIATGLTGTSFTWTPSGLPSDTYAIEITDGTTTNYSPQFTYAGTGAAVTTTTGSATTTGTSSTASSTPTDDSTTTGSTTSSSATTLTTSTASSTGNATTTASSTTSRSSTSSSSSSSSSSTSTPVNTNNAEKMGSPLAFIMLTAAALMAFH